MKARLESFVPYTCCAAAVPMMATCCPRYHASADDAPALFADLADLTEKAVGLAFTGAAALYRKLAPAFRAAAAARQ